MFRDEVRQSRDQNSEGRHLNTRGKGKEIVGRNQEWVKVPKRREQAVTKAKEPIFRFGSQI